MRLARTWHGVTAVVVIVAFVIELILVSSGASVLVEDDPPPLGQRLFRLVSYFTIQANALVLVAAIGLLRNPERDGRWWRIGRYAAIVGITVTGLVHWFLLRPLLDLSGWAYAGDRLLHLVAPLLAVIGWLAFGPRPRIDGRTFGLALIWPAGWLVATLIVGGVTGWYPYPFLNLGVLGPGPVALVALGITGLIVVIGALLWWADRTLPPR